MNILDKIVEKTKERVLELDLEYLKNNALKLPVINPNPFKQALLGKGIKIIAEIKKASPSKGLICADFDPEKIAYEYTKANVDCISVLTEPDFFMGDNSYVQLAKNASNKPILRKDFIISEAQIYEAKIIGADCILLICAILDEVKLQNFLKIAHSLGLAALVETHNEDEIKMAIKSGAEIIGVNNRNLKTFEVDFKNSLNLKHFVPDDIIFVSESGIRTREDVSALENAKVNAVLIGETFMRSKDKTTEINRLRPMKIKICGIKTVDEAYIMNDFLPEFIGFVFAKSKRQVSIEQAIEIKKILNPLIKCTGVFVDLAVEEIIQNYKKIIDVVQLHGDYNENDIISLKNEGFEVIKVVRVKESLYNIYTKADYVLFDTYSKTQAGGLNQTFNWNIEIKSNAPYFVAGGLNFDNILEMKQKLNPYGADISSGVEVEGFKTKEKVSNIINIIRGKSL